MRYKDYAGRTKAQRVTAGLEDLNEGRKVIAVSNRETIAIDDPHVKGQQVHAHLDSGRAVNIDGSRSHGGEPFRLTKDQAAALRRLDFKIAKSRLVEGEESMLTVALESELVNLLLQLKQLAEHETP